MVSAAKEQSDARAQQLRLVDEPGLWQGVDVAELHIRSAELRENNARSAAMQRTYATHWRHFREWGETARVPAPLPARQPEHVLGAGLKQILYRYR